MCLLLVVATCVSIHLESLLKNFHPQIYDGVVTGTSAGALVASVILCNASLESCTMGVIKTVLQVRHGILGPITPDLDIMTVLRENMSEILPEDAHLYCNGKLHISVTRYEDCQNVLLNQFESKEDLLQALMCSCFIPVYCGFEPPKFHGVAYVDGGYSNNCPKLNAHTITVAPFYGDTDICPRDSKGDFRTLMLNGTSIFLTLENCRRLLRVLFPGPPNMMKELCQRGYNDALRFLRDNGLIQCPDCSVNGNGTNYAQDRGHINCKPIEYTLPTEVTDEMDAAAQRHQGFGHRLLRNPIVKMLYYVNMPGIFTAKVSYSFLTAIARKLQSKAGVCLDNVLNSQTKSNANLMCHMETGHLDTATVKIESVNGQFQNISKTCQHPAELNENMTVELEISGSENGKSFYTNDNLLHMTLSNNEHAYNHCKNMFHVTGVSKHAIEIDGKDIQVPNVFVVN